MGALPPPQPPPPRYVLDFLQRFNCTPSPPPPTPRYFLVVVFLQGLKCQHFLTPSTRQLLFNFVTPDLLVICWSDMRGMLKTMLGMLTG